MSTGDDVRPLLQLDGVTRRFGSLVAVGAVTTTVARGERRALIGPNGAGKTTLLDLIGGTDTPSAGRIVLDGRDVTRLPEHRRARLGMARTFQRSCLFEGLTAAENVAVAVRRRLGIAHRMWRPAGRFGDVTARAVELVERVGLGGRGQILAGELSHGERRQLEVAVALATEPSLLLLDEPAAGMSLAEAAGFVAMVAALPAALTVVVVEHDMEVAFALADRVTVLEAGRVSMEGTPDEVRASDEVRRAYLGARQGEIFAGPDLP